MLKGPMWMESGAPATIMTEVARAARQYLESISGGKEGMEM